MLEWMHDESVVKDLKADFASKTIYDCEKFIESSWIDKNNYHYAIDVDGNYMGTVSLKNVKKNRAEFAIAIRTVAMGKGISKQAMQEIIRIGFEELGLSQIYWYVDKTNARAIRFYDKNRYRRVEEYMLSEDESSSYVWYAVDKEGKYT